MAVFGYGAIDVWALMQNRMYIYTLIPRQLIMNI